MRHFIPIFSILALVAFACTSTGAPSAAPQALETVTPLQVQNEAPTATPASTPLPMNTAVPVRDYAIFPINVQDFSHPAESAAVLDKIITLHERSGAPVDIYLTDVMA